MTVYAPADHHAVTVPADEEHGGCGKPHVRDLDENGRPVAIWSVSCPACEQWLLTHDDRWVRDVADIKPTYDEQRAADKWAVQGAKDQQMMLTAAVAQLAGFGPAQMPESLQRMLGGLKPHIPVAGAMVCSQCQAAQPPGQRYCGQCGAAMASPVPAASVTAGAAS
jgi:hypothetical protein